MTGRRTRKVAAPAVEFASPGAAPSGLVEIRCVVSNVHLGDGRVLRDLEHAFVTPEVAKIITDSGMAVYV